MDGERPPNVDQPPAAAPETTRVEPDPQVFVLTAKVPDDWQLQALPAWLEVRGERSFTHRSVRARLYRYVNVWDDGGTQEMWSVYVSSPDKPDAVCIKLDLALSMFERFRKPGYIAKSGLLPWRT
jgi:hypothetical protein